ncbi:MAG: DUF3189 family protein [Firmicutes bacterium]|nr:DUF3189 family protein [Bacillota bacterium]
MHIIYHCVGGTHSSAIAAAVHLGKLPMNERPKIKDLYSIPYFDTLTKKDRGRIIYRGLDIKGNKIFTLSRQFVPEIVIPAIEDTWLLAGGNKNDYILIDTMPAVNLLMKIGGFSSRRLNLVSFGRPIVAKGTLKTYPNIVNIVKNTLNTLEINDH